MLLTILFFMLSFYLIYMLFQIWKDNGVSLILKVSLMFLFGFWYFIPYLTTSESSPIRSFPLISYDKYMMYYIIEAIYWIVSLHLFRFLNKRFKRYNNTSTLFGGDFQFNKQVQNLVFWVFIVVYTIRVFDKVGSMEAYLLTNAVGYRERNGLMNMVFHFAPQILLFYIFFQYKKMSKLKIWIAISLIIVSSMASFFHGTRIAIMMPLAIFIIIYFQTRSRVLFGAVVGMAVVALVMAPILSVWRQSGEERFDMNTTSSYKGQNTRSVFEELNIKTISVYHGAVMCEKVGWGVAPQVILNTVLCNIPIGKRPVPLSVNGEESGTITRVAAQINGGSYYDYIDENSIGSTGTRESEVALFVAGIWGIIISVIACGFLIWLCNTWLMSGVLFPCAFALSILQFGEFENPFSPLSFIRDFPRYLFVYVLFWIVANLLFVRSSKRVEY